MPANGSWPAGVAAARSELIAAFDIFVPRHSHSVGQILLFLRLTLQSVLGFRGAASALAKLFALFPTDELAASASSGQSWLLRLGLYVLLQPKEQATDWIWLVDHTIQSGKGKCLVVTGIRQAKWNMIRLPQNASGALVCTDLSIWQIELVESSNGEKVEAQLETLCQEQKVVPRAIVSDCGGDLSAGIASFCCKHEHTIPLKDLPHFIANVLKKILTDDSRWAAFLEDANRSKTKLRQTKFAFLLPPDLKTKARWMNLDPLIAWSTHVLEFLTTPRAVRGVSWNAEELETAMGWLRNHDAALRSWRRLLDVAGASLKYIRKEGYHRGAARELCVVLDELQLAPTSQAAYLANRVVEYVEEQSQPLQEGEHLLATSEVLESLLGKAKQLQGQQSRSGFTKMILGIAASVADLTTETVADALNATKVSDIAEWLRQKLPASVQGQRFRALHAATTEQN